MSSQIAVRIPNEDLEALDSIVDSGRFQNRAEAVRAALEKLLCEERDRVIAEEYRKAYEKIPQEEWIGEAGAAALGEILADSPSDRNL